MVPGVLEKLRLWPVRAGVAIVDGGLLRRDLMLCETGISLEDVCNPLGRVVASTSEEATVTPHKLPNAVIGAGNNNKVQKQPILVYNKKLHQDLRLNYLAHGEKSKSRIALASSL